MIKSLRGRLFAGLTAIILLTGLIGGLFAHHWAFNEAIEMQDSVLIQIASLVQAGSLTGGRELHGVDEDAEVWLIDQAATPQASGDEARLWSVKDGLALATRKGQPIRVLLRTRPDGTRFAVAQRTSVRDEIASDMAFRTVLPIAALIPCLLLVTAIVVARSLRPMVRLADDLDGRRADDMTLLPAGQMPSELHPFIASINGLLQRVGLLMDQQRRFVADAAHELRTPITALSLQAENLDAVDLPANARGRVVALRQGIGRTRHLLDQLLALARQDAGQDDTRAMPVVKLDDVAKEVVADLLPEATGRGVDLGFARLEPALVRGEAVILAAVVRNLLDNALRFTPQGGRIDTCVYRDGDAALLQIEDSGPGVASAELGRIFDPFFRGQRPAGDGAGLGLSIVKRIVDRLEGTIEAVNLAEGGRSGLRVLVKLPGADA
ncbi:MULTISPECIES: ATP-binding protein [Bradyrhizobium]|jgi:two-component system OmpR family sensor kinase|uniref:histidine kinase n=1 Tax=Bradyrhizobium arachidis TaxID=858423 RepID=A0AAE7NM12_9BRAD|nr:MULTISPECIES: ATP-binding protein [Bradyrhizobium]QOG19082.1 two-component sensor histidine kinase [Bradyrhizobium sp. SEMIA]QOZ68384.1 two-component sensor histidine kinase [Bradyrhizobium arachidis]UFW53027.1 two-component sensor histidine kinase [Bradyrhizobium arachidis]SFV02632.1 two-component system, OmpR family, sensor kinase [Bradyrhizobium arachidis]